jgi:hypothetical protein
VTTLLECIPIGVLELNITNELNRIKAAYYDILFIKSAKRQQQMFDLLEYTPTMLSQMDNSFLVTLPEINVLSRCMELNQGRVKR